MKQKQTVRVEIKLKRLRGLLQEISELQTETMDQFPPKGYMLVYRSRIHEEWQLSRLRRSP